MKVNLTWAAAICLILALFAVAALEAAPDADASGDPELLQMERGESGESGSGSHPADDNPPPPVEEDSGNASDESESPDCFPAGSVNLKHNQGGCS